MPGKCGLQRKPPPTGTSTNICSKNLSPYVYPFLSSSISWHLTCRQTKHGKLIWIDLTTKTHTWVGPSMPQYEYVSESRELIRESVYASQPLLLKPLVLWPYFFACVCHSLDTSYMKSSPAHQSVEGPTRQ